VLCFGVVSRILYLTKADNFIVAAVIPPKWGATNKLGLALAKLNRFVNATALAKMGKL